MCKTISNMRYTIIWLRKYVCQHRVNRITGKHSFHLYLLHFRFARFLKDADARIAAVVGLVQAWVFNAGARRLGAEAAWQEFLWRQRLPGAPLELLCSDRA